VLKTAAMIAMPKTAPNCCRVLRVPAALPSRVDAAASSPPKHIVGLGQISTSQRTALLNAYHLNRNSESIRRSLFVTAPLDGVLERVRRG